MDPIAGRRFLIAHSIVQRILGATVVTLELAEFLIERGAEVTVYAAFLGDPALSLFRERGVTVVDDRTFPDLRLTDLDVVWVHSQVVPLPILEQLAGPLPERMPPFVFLHMSALDLAPDEHPYIPGLEARLSSLSLFVAPATREQLLPAIGRPVATGIYPNPAPRSFAEHPYRRKERPERILIVSNHSVPEVAEARDLLRDRGFEVRHLGAPHDAYELVTPALLAGADVVVTIGKTVPYCLVAGIPVFVYDHYGGYGYLDEDNLERARFRNFSGRGGVKLSAERLVADILDGYADAAAFQAHRRAYFWTEFGIDEVLPPLLESLQPYPVQPFDPAFLAAVDSAQRFGARFYRYWGRNIVANRRLARARGELAHAHRELTRVCGELTRVRGELADRETPDRPSDQGVTPRSGRVGRLVRLPASALRRVRNRFGRTQARVLTEGPRRRPAAGDGDSPAVG
ncbi:MAG: hypothetical protein U0R64_01310 [Candidatus Nanopelagicales bacterium]